MLKLIRIIIGDELRFAHKLWCVRFGVLWAIIGGIWVALPSFEAYLPPFRFLGLCVAFSLAILYARLTHQVGLPDG